ncbi:MAG: hypothetical protein ACOH2O_04230 [Pseudomonas sp.]|jgi:hypothetical protein|uniref:hypothetical protein n=1 Tax=Pseudomonas sp. UMAB-08 TaxID=1365375 RepID=UPI001C59863D|nr:hypothetical protein [Pseudomonas sp. UMAB-08]
MTLEEMNIPLPIKIQAADIITRIEQSTGIIDATMAGGIAEGFVLGIVCLKAMQPKDIDQLETLFSQASDRKMAGLK